MNSSVQIQRLQRQVKLLQLGMAALAVLLCLSAAVRPDDLRTRRLIIEDAGGHDRIVLDARGQAARPTIDFRSAAGVRRLVIGEAPDPVIDGKTYPRIAPAWGLLIHDPHGEERGGFSYLDTGRSVISLDRAHGEGVYMTVNEKSGFAGLVANYETGKAGNYAEALRIGTLGDQAFAQATNRDGIPAGALLVGKSGRAKLIDVVQH